MIDGRGWHDAESDVLLYSCESGRMYFMLLASSNDHKMIISYFTVATTSYD